MKSVCNVPHCPNIAVKDGRCSKHQKIPWSGRRNFEHYKGDWQKIRRQVLKEEPNCRLCGRPAVTVDHIVPRSRGGIDERSNLQPLCSVCRRRKDAKDAADGRRFARLS
jgi:5-methylcytosine-specific restriction enzyme A